MAENRETPSVLFVDDEDGNLKGFQAAFRKDFHIFLAESGAEALDILAEEHIDVLVADHRMPNMTGAELLAIAAQRYPEIIRFMVTAYSDIEAVVDAINKGQISGYFTKPINPEQFLQKTNQALESYFLKLENKKLLARLEKTNTSLEKKTNDLEKQVLERKNAEQKVKEALQEFKDLLEAAPDAIVIADYEGIIHKVNSMAEKLFNQPRDEIIGTNINNYIKTEDHDKAILPPARQLLSNQLEEAILYPHDAQEIYVQINLNPDSAQDDHYFIASIRDISKQRKIQKAIQESEQRYRTLLESFPQRVFYKDIDGKFVKTNSQMSHDFGLSPEEIIGKDDFDIHPQKYAEKFKQIDRQVIAEKKSIEQVEEQICHGETLFFRTFKSPVYDNAGNVIGILGSSSNVTDTIQIEKELEQERFLFKSFMDNMPDNIYFKDKQGHFLRANKAMIQYFGLQDETEIIGKTDFDFFSEEHAQNAFDREKEIMQSGTAGYFEEKETWPGKPDTWVSTVKIPLYDTDHQVIGTFGLSRDITAQKEKDLKIRDINEELVLLNEINMISRKKDAVKLTIDLIFNFLKKACQAEHLIFFDFDEKQNRLLNKMTVLEDSYFAQFDKVLGESARDVIGPDIYGKGPYARSLRDKKSFVMTDQKEIAKALQEWIPDKLVKKMHNRQIVNRGMSFLDITATGAIPLATEQSILGMITFNSKAPVSTALLNRMNRIGSQVSMILEKTKNSEKLEDFQRKMQLALEASFTGFWTWDLRKNDMWWDKRTSAILGVDEDITPSLEILKKIAHPDDLQVALAKLGQVLEGAVIRDFFLRVIHPDNSIHHVLFRGKALKDENNDVFFINSLCIDVTDQKEAETALQETNNRIKALTGALPDLIFLINEDGRYLEVLTSEDRLLYEKAEKIKGSTIYDIMPSQESIKNIEYLIAKTLKTDALQTFQFTRDVPIGKRWFEGRMAPLKGEIEGKRAVVYVARDITDRKEAESKLAELNEQLEQRIIERTRQVEDANELLKQSEDRLNLAFTGSNISWFDWDVKSGRFLTHENLAVHLGYGKEKNQNHINWWLSKLMPSDLKILRKQIKLLENGELSMIDREVQLQQKDKNYNWYLIRGVIVSKDDKGKASRVVGIFQNILKRKIAEREREKQNHYLNTLLNTLPTPIYSVDADFNFATCNNAFENCFDVHHNAIIGKSAREQEIHSDFQFCDEYDEKLLTKAGSEQYEKVLVQNDVEKNLVISKATLVDEKDKPEGIITIISDISDIKKAEKKLMESEERYRMLFDASPDGILIAESPKLEVRYANSAAEKLFGFTLDEFYSLTIPQLHPEETRLPEKLIEIREFLKYNKSVTIDIPILKKDGSITQTDLRVSPLVMNGKSYMMGIFRDITERLQAEDALKESEKRFRELTDLLPQAVFELDREGRFVYVNKFGLEATGYSQEDVHKGVMYSEIIAAESMAASRIYLSTVLRGKRTRPHEYRLKRKDGSTFPCMIYSSPIVKDGKVAGIRGITMDITERKKIEEELKAHAAELQLFNKSMLGREKRIIELKEQVNELALQLGKKVPYPPIWN